MSVLSRQYIFASIAIHLLFMLFALVNYSRGIKQSFVVYGAHSSRPTYAYFKTSSSTQTKQGAAKKRALLKKTKLAKAKLAKKKRMLAIAKKKKLAKEKLAKAKLAKEKKEREKIEHKEQERLEKEQQENLEVDEQDATNVQNLDDVIAIEGISINDPESVIYLRAVQQEIDRVWRPPVGISQGTESSMKFVLNDDGSVKNYEWIKRSNMIVYDASILQMLKKLKFSKRLWGLTFTVKFLQ